MGGSRRSRKCYLSEDKELYCLSPPNILYQDIEGREKEFYDTLEAVSWMRKNIEELPEQYKLIDLSGVKLIGGEEW